MSCQFSSPYQHTGKNICYSLCSNYLASSYGSNLILKNSLTLQDIQIFPCIDKIDKIEFSFDSQYILCGIYNRSVIQVFSLNDFTWRCRINESIAGIISTGWCPDSRHILVESDFGIQLSIWSLVENTSYIINSPKLNCYSFSDCKRYLVVGHRLECKDHIAIYSVNPWNELNKFTTRTKDLVAVQWTPSGTHIVVQDSHLYYCLMVYTPAGEIVTQYEAYHNALGIRTISFHRPEYSLVNTSSICPSQLLAIGSYDGQVHLLSTRTWKLAFVLPQTHPSEMTDYMRNDVIMTVEVIENENSNSIETDIGGLTNSIGDLSMFSAKRSKTQTGHLGSSYVTKSLKSLPRLTKSNQMPKNELQLPKFGVSWMSWSDDGNYLAVREESYPRCLWIWKGLEAKLCDLLVQLDSIVCARWMPQKNQTEDDSEINNEQEPILAFCCNTSRVYFWRLSGSSWADLPTTLAIFTPNTNIPSSIPNRSHASVASKSSSTSVRSSNLANKSSSSTTTAAIPPIPQPSGVITESEEKISSGFLVTNLKWCPDGKRIILIGKDRYCSCDVTFDFNNEVILNNFEENINP